MTLCGNVVPVLRVRLSRLRPHQADHHLHRQDQAQYLACHLVAPLFLQVAQLRAAPTFKQRPMLLMAMVELAGNQMLA